MTATSNVSRSQHMQMAAGKRNSINTTEKLKFTLRPQLQAAVQSIKWTYSAFWQLASPKEVLVWGDGYYNGAIKTRKTVQAAELSQEELGMQRTQQLRDLYETLSTTGDGNQATNRRPSASLTPEDLTETEWFYLLCMSCSFSPGTGLPGQALAKSRYVWLKEANEATTDTFTRSLLAKTANIQTVLCIPISKGVVEFGSTELINEDSALVQHVRTFFAEHLKPVGSELSTSSPQTPDERDSVVPQQGRNIDDTFSRAANWISANLFHPSSWVSLHQQEQLVTFPQENGREGGNAPMLVAGQSDVGIPSKSWEMLQGLTGMNGNDLSQLQGTPEGRFGCMRSSLEASQQSMPDLLDNGHSEDSQEPMQVIGLSAFAEWRNIPLAPEKGLHPTSQQWMLKNALFEVTRLCRTHDYELTHKPKEVEISFGVLDSKNRVGPKKPSGGQEDLNVSHVLAERRRREKLNDRFMVLRALVPFVTKEAMFPVEQAGIFVKILQFDIRSDRYGIGFNRGMGRTSTLLAEDCSSSTYICIVLATAVSPLDNAAESYIPLGKMDKASILGDAIEYVKQLQKRIQDLELRNRQLQNSSQQFSNDDANVLRSSDMAPNLALYESFDRLQTGLKLNGDPFLEDDIVDMITNVTENGSYAQPDSKSSPSTLLSDREEVGFSNSTSDESEATHGKRTEESTADVKVTVAEDEAVLELQCPWRKSVLIDILQALNKLHLDVLVVRASATNGTLNTICKAKGIVKGTKLWYQDIPLTRAMRAVQ